MSPELAPYLVVAWVVGTVAVFPSFPPHRSVLLIVLSGVLFLPEVGRNEVAVGPFHFTKIHATSYAALLGALLHDGRRVLAGPPRWVDLPMAVWCLIPIPSVLSNDPPPDGSLPLRDALSQALAQAVTYGIPYLLGRVYFSDPAAVRDLARGVVLAAAAYAPLCLYEARMSPNLHLHVYGFAQHSFGQTIRYGGYRPQVFMQHGLALGMFLAAATLVAFWLRAAGTLAPAGRRPAGWWGALPWVLAVTTVLCKSTGAIALGLVGGLALWRGRRTGSRGWLLALAAVPPAYVVTRVTGAWDGKGVVELTAEYLDAERAQSFNFRLVNEDMLVKKALERPFFGWGGWGRGRVYDKDGKDVSITDGLWIIELGNRGVVGLVALGAAVLLPVYRFAAGVPVARWSAPEVAPAAACAVVLVLWCIDSLPNAMLNPVYLLMAGALARWGVTPAPGPAVSRA